MYSGKKSADGSMQYSQNLVELHYTA